MYLPFCGIAISNAQLFAASRKEYDRSRVRAKGQLAAPPHPVPTISITTFPLMLTLVCVLISRSLAVVPRLLPLQWGIIQFLSGDGLAQRLVYDLNLRGTVKR